jgi:hypothetical protein
MVTETFSNGPGCRLSQPRLAGILSQVSFRVCCVVIADLNSQQQSDATDGATNSAYSDSLQFCLLLVQYPPHVGGMLLSNNSN